MKFSKFFNINKSQAELDFVDIPLNTDIPLFLDPYAFSQREDYWSSDCHACIKDYFQMVIDLIKNSKDEEALKLLSFLSEPNETRLGLSKGKPQGRGVAHIQARALYEKLKDSSAVRTGVLTDLEECELYIENIARDKISDMTTNIIRYYLIQYTLYQCDLHNIKTRPDVPSGFFWDQENHEWRQDYYSLPIYDNKKILLTPKALTRFDLAYDHKDYYSHFIVNFLQAKHFANGSLVRTLKSGEKKLPYKKDIKARYPFSKNYIYSFTRDNPSVLDRYKRSISKSLRELTNEQIELLKKESDFNITSVVDGLISRLKATPSGLASASTYHDLVIGILEVIVYPDLIQPRKEAPINEGRKRIDISYKNAARLGFFQSLHTTHRLPCPNIFFECKNYSSDPANPEIDQLQGRFKLNSGVVGFLVCRQIKDKHLFMKRCKDVYTNGRGCIIPLEDTDLIQLMEFIKNGETQSVNNYLKSKLRQVLSA